MNAAAWIGYDRYFTWRHMGSLRIDAFEPGEGAVVDARPRFVWHFSADVIPTSIYHAEPGTMSPAVAGHWDWSDPRTLSFTPDVDLPRARELTFTLASSLLRSSTGATLGGQCVNSVRSTPLVLEEVRQAAAAENDCYVLELRFSDRVAPGDVISHLHVADPDGKRVQCELIGQAADKIVRVRTEPIAAMVAGGKGDANEQLGVDVNVSNGLAGLSGPLGLGEDQNAHVALSRRLSATGLTCNIPVHGEPTLELAFNNDVDLATVKEILSIDPPIPFTCSSWNASSIVLHGDFQPETRYLVRLASGPKGADVARYPRPATLAVFVGDRGRGVWFDNDEGYLSAKGNRTLIAHTMNTEEVRLSVTRVYDDNLVAWRNAQGRGRAGNIDDFAKPLIERTIHLPAKKNVQHDVTISLDDLLPTGAERDGVYRICVQMNRPGTGSDDEANDNGDTGWGSSASSLITLSDIGLTAKRTRDGMMVWAVSLRTAEPLAGVRARLYSEKNQLLGEATTDADGTATIEGVHPASGESPAVLLASQLPPMKIEPLGPETPTTKPSEAASSGLTWLDLRRSQWELGESDTSGGSYLRGGYEAFVYEDRGVYRPGETVHLRAIVRGPDGTTPAGTFPVRWQFRRPDHHDWVSKIVMLDNDGAAAVDMPLPSDLVTGNWSASIGLPSASTEDERTFGSTSFGVEEFVPNRMKVRLSLPGEDAAKAQETEQAGEHAAPRFAMASAVKASVQGDYLFGRPAANLPVDLTVRAEPAEFSPPHWSGWAFGSPAEVADPVRLRRGKAAKEEAATDAIPDASLDENGNFIWSIEVAKVIGVDPGTVPQKMGTQFAGPWRLTASAAVREAGGRAVTAVRQMEIDALPAYIGARRAEAATLRPGEPCAIELCMVRPDGTMARENSDAIRCTLFRESWNTVLNFEQGRYHYNSTRVLEQLKSESITLADGFATWRPVMPTDGEYVAEFRDAQTGATTRLELRAEDGSPWDDNVDRANPEHVDLQVVDGTDPDTANKTKGVAKFAIGGTANVLVASPFAGRLLLTVETDTVVKTTVLDMKASHAIVPIEITEAMRPNAFISASVVRAIDPQAKWRTHRAFGVMRLRVDPTDRQLKIAISAPTEMRPERTMDVALQITDSNQQPVGNAAITVAAVDEGICALTDFATPDPLKFFQANRALSVESGDIYSLLMPEVARPDKTSAIGGDDGSATDARRHSPVVAHRFVPVALAWQTAHSDATGIAHVSFAVPQFQGRLRVMAVAHLDKLSGCSDAGVTVRSPILAQTSWPRFAAPGDRFTVPVVLLNNTDARGSAIVHIQAAPQDGAGNLLGFGTEKQADLELPPVMLGARGQTQIDLPVTVEKGAGIARVRLAASMNGETFEENLELPVRPGSPMMEFGGTAAASTTQPTALDHLQTLLPGTEVMNVRVTPWPTLRIPQGLDYLDRYPYGCVEQTTSAIFPLVALGDLGKQLDSARFDPARMKETVSTGIVHLIEMQTPDGGLAMWPGGSKAWPWGTVYAANFLVEARTAGYDVPDDFYNHTLTYTRRLLDNPTDDANALEVQTYAAYVLALAGTPPRAAIDRLTELTNPARNASEDGDYSRVREHSRLMLACAWMLMGRHDLAEGMIPQELPIPRTSRQRDGNIGSPIRDRAVLINALVMVQPANPALPSLVQQLADEGAKGRWASTQDTAFAVMAISRYLHLEQKHEPYDTARLLLGTRVLAEVNGGSSLAWDAPAAVTSPAFSPATTQPDALRYTVQLTGAPGAMGYVTCLQSGVPLAAPADASHGISIKRRYLTMDGKEIPHNVIRTGDLVLVELTLKSSVPEHGLAIEDMLPAGLEIENAHLSTAAKEEDNSTTTTDFRRFEAARTDVRDDRMVIIGSMPVATAQWTYLARAVTPGIYVLPPVRVEAMYDINTNAISGAGGTFVVSSPNANVADIRN